MINSGYIFDDLPCLWRSLQRKSKKQFSLWLSVNLIDRSVCFEKERDIVFCTCLWKKLEILNS